MALWQSMYIRESELLHGVVSYLYGFFFSAIPAKIMPLVIAAYSHFPLSTLFIKTNPGYTGFVVNPERPIFEILRSINIPKIAPSIIAANLVYMVNGVSRVASSHIKPRKPMGGIEFAIYSDALISRFTMNMTSRVTRLFVGRLTCFNPSEIPSFWRIMQNTSEIFLSNHSDRPSNQWLSIGKMRRRVIEFLFRSAKPRRKIMLYSYKYDVNTASQEVYA